MISERAKDWDIYFPEIQRLNLKKNSSVGAIFWGLVRLAETTIFILRLTCGILYNFPPWKNIALRENFADRPERYNLNRAQSCSFRVLENMRRVLHLFPHFLAQSA
jgi:hypothetical protein